MMATRAISIPRYFILFILTKNRDKQVMGGRQKSGKRGFNLQGGKKCQKRGKFHHHNRCGYL
jgi:hypothetical protein